MSKTAPLITDNFLLENEFAQELYHSYAKNLPIIDYHCHLPPDEIAANRSFENITKIWIDGDHYKWRSIRHLGIPEDYITGKKSDWQKFEKWAYTVPYTMRNPLFHWTHLELKRYFGIDTILSPETAPAIYKTCNTLLSTPEFTAQSLIQKMNVEMVGTTDDPLDDLSHHKAIANSDFETQVFPTFRPDSLIFIEKVDFKDYIDTLSSICAIPVTDLESLKAAIKNRVHYFHQHGCRISDHGLPHMYAAEFSESQVNKILTKRLQENALTADEIYIYKSAILVYLGTCYAELNWTMQLHLGPIRDTNKALLEQIGLNAGVDSIGDFQHAEQLARFLNKLNDKGHLPKTILYNSNPSDNEVFATMIGNFSGENIKGKVQFGAAWWFLDQKDGITKQIDALSNMGLLSCSIGMLTDSRSFLSYPRHEYYRRILCNIFGNEIKKGELPNDMKWIGKLVSDICYHNAKDFFKFPKPIKNSVEKLT